MEYVVRAKWIGKLSLKPRWLCAGLLTQRFCRHFWLWQCGRRILKSIALSQLPSTKFAFCTTCMCEENDIPVLLLTEINQMLSILWLTEQRQRQSTCVFFPCLHFFSFYYDSVNYYSTLAWYMWLSRGVYSLILGEAEGDSEYLDEWVHCVRKSDMMLDGLGDGQSVIIIIYCCYNCFFASRSLLSLRCKHDLRHKLFVAKYFRWRIKVPTTSGWDLDLLSYIDIVRCMRR